MNIKGIVIFLMLLLGVASFAQTFDLVDRTESYTSGISETIRIPIKIKNTSDKAQFYIIRLVGNDLSGTQKGYFCLDKTCLDPGATEFSKKIEAGQTLEGLHFFLETGLVTGQYPIKFEIFARGNIQTMVEHHVNVQIEEKQLKSTVFQSKDITVHDVYPNPVFDQAYIDYKLQNEAIKAKLVVHNILGSSMVSNDMPPSESRVKISADDLSPGIYFYTVYLDNIGVLTRKLIVRR
jgi:Secretion system C-terminal sorting domain